MHNFNAERFALAASAVGFAWVCYQEALGWARERHTFGKRLADHQVVRHRLVDMLSAHRGGARACSRRPPGGSTTARPATRR